MILSGALLLAGFTARSQAYAQAMAAAGLAPERVMLFGPEKPLLPGQAGDVKQNDGIANIFLPDMDIPLKTTCSENGWSVEQLASHSVNEPEIRSAVENAAPRLVIYSGYGSQIVGADLLGLGAPFLHAHSGWLPDFRGSTTMYYSWLLEGRCGVSAVFLQDSIDTGPIVNRRFYTPPPAGIDPDYVYDNAIRADLLVRTLQEYARGGLLSGEAQPDAGTSYYVIHPVLKHLARMCTRPVDKERQRRQPGDA